MSEPIAPPATARRWRAAGATHPGLVRTHNEDRFYCDAAEGLFVVIDGVGGHQAGEVAAGIALDLLVRRLRRRTGTPADRLREGIALANNEIHRQAQAAPEQAGMACVLTAAVLDGDHLTVGHVGDTRLYHLHDGRLEKVTRDHSPVGMQEDAGMLSEHDAMRHPRRNEIYRDVGSMPREPDADEFMELFEVTCSPRSALLLCSDGLTDLVPAAAVRTVLEAEAGRPDVAAEALIDQANAAGGKDNITVVVAMGAAFGTPDVPPRAEEATDADAHEDAAPARMPHRGRRAALPFLLGVVVGIVLLTLLQSFVLGRLGGDASARTFDVAADSSAAHVTIAAALQAARPGDRIRLARGVYAESVALPAGVALVGGPEVVLRPPAGPALILRDGSRAERLVLDAGGDSTATGVVASAGTAVLDEVTVRGFGTAIAADAGAVLTVRASRIEDNGLGVVLAPGARARLLHSFVVGTGAPADTAATGVVVPEGAAVELDGNVFARNAGGAVSVTASSRTAAVRDRNVFLDSR